MFKKKCLKANFMKNYVFDGEEEEKENVEEGDSASDDEGFIDGFMEDDEITECAECGGAVTEEKKVVKEIEGEEYTFCSDACAKEYQEGLN